MGKKKKAPKGFVWQWVTAEGDLEVQWVTLKGSTVNDDGDPVLAPEIMERIEGVQPVVTVQMRDKEARIRQYGALPGHSFKLEETPTGGLAIFWNGQPRVVIAAGVWAAYEYYKDLSQFSSPA